MPYEPSRNADEADPEVGAFDDLAADAELNFESEQASWMEDAPFFGLEDDDSDMEDNDNDLY